MKIYLNQYLRMVTEVASGIASAKCSKPAPHGIESSKIVSGAMAVVDEILVQVEKKGFTNDDGTGKKKGIEPAMTSAEVRAMAGLVGKTMNELARAVEQESGCSRVSSYRIIRRAIAEGQIKRDADGMIRRNGITV